MKSLAMIVPAAMLTAANALGEALGYGPENFTIPCGDGQSVTHFAGYLANADAFLTVIAAAQAGHLPAGVEPAVLAPILAVLALDVSESGDSYGHLTAALDQRGLQRM